MDKIIEIENLNANSINNLKWSENDHEKANKFVKKPLLGAAFLFVLRLDCVSLILRAYEK